MDNKKIGKLIANLRKKQGLTQQSLGDKVGVGFRAVSKWERGLTLPDISIINELSHILGISSDELLSGELKKDNPTKEKKKIPTSIKITISIITVIILGIISALIYFNNKTYIYDLKSPDDENYFVEGQLTFKGAEMTIIINKLKFQDQAFSSTIIKDYEYYIKSGNNYIFGYGKDPNGNYIDDSTSVEEILKTISTNYIKHNHLKRTKIIDNNMCITLEFLDVNDNTITKEIKIILVPHK